MTEQTWKDFTHKLVLDYCNEKGSRTFSLQEFQTAKETEIISFKENNKHPFDKIRQQLQILRQNEIVSFVDGRGTYTLRKPEILKNELADEAVAFVHQKEPSKQEYIREVYSRDRGWVKAAKEKFGCYCLHPNCSNTFQKQDGTPYIEVHHILPLYQGGEDALWNLTVVCAHHHKMAHFADLDTQKGLRRTFLNIVDKLL